MANKSKRRNKKVFGRKPTRVIYAISRLPDPPYKEEITILDFTQ